MDAITQEDLMKIRDIILKELMDVEAIYLFGSVARGTHNANSDYDIVVFVKNIPHDKIESITNIRNNASDKIIRSIDLFVLDRDYLKFASPFLYEVYHNNILLHGMNIIAECTDLVKDMYPLIIDGEKVGYKMKASNAVAIKHMLDAFDDKQMLGLLNGQDFHSILLQHMERLCESATNACLCTINIAITKEHAFSTFIEKILIPEAGKFKEELVELLPNLHKIQDESVYSRDVVIRDDKIVLREYSDEEISSLLDATMRYYELCYSIIESRIGDELPRTKDGLKKYLKTNYPEYLDDRVIQAI